MPTLGALRLLAAAALAALLGPAGAAGSPWKAPHAAGAGQGQCPSGPAGMSLIQKAPALLSAGLRQRPSSQLQLDHLAGEGDVSASAAPEDRVAVVSYNLFWWNVAATNRFDALHDRIRGELPFDLIGFQECNDVASVVTGAGMDGFEYYQGPSPNPCPLAWNAKVFSKVGEPGSKWVANDQWGDRHMVWVRLQHVATGKTVLFVNTHGPLNGCDGTLGSNWLQGIKGHLQAGDVAFMTGDFNCPGGTAALSAVRGLLTETFDGGIDHILSTGRKISGESKNGYPSDHPLIRGIFSLGAEQAAQAITAESSSFDPPSTTTPVAEPTTGVSTTQPLSTTSGETASATTVTEAAEAAGAAETEGPAPPCGETEASTDYNGGDLRDVGVLYRAGAAACGEACRDQQGCLSFTFSVRTSACYLKGEVKPGRSANACCTSGLPACPAETAETAPQAETAPLEAGPLETAPGRAAEAAEAEEVEEAEVPSTTCGDLEEHYNYNGGDLKKPGVIFKEDAKACSEACRDQHGCLSFTFSLRTSACYLKGEARPGRRRDACCTSGAPACGRHRRRRGGEVAEGAAA